MHTLILTIGSVLRVPIESVGMSMQLSVEFCLGLLVSRRLGGLVGGFVAVLVLSCFFPSFTKESYYALHAVLVGAGLLLLIKDGLTALCIAGVCQCLWQGLQCFGIDPLFHFRDSVQYVGLMGNGNYSAAFLAICFPAFLRNGWIWVTPLIVLGLCLSSAIGGVVALGLGLAVLVCVYGWWRWVVLVLVPIGAYLFIDFPGVERFDAWKNILYLAIQHPVFGSGLGNYKTIIHQIPAGNSFWSMSHNEYLQVFFEVGMVGFVLLCGVCWRALRNIKNVNQITALGVLTVMVGCVFNPTFHIAPTALAGLVWLKKFEVELCGNT